MALNPVVGGGRGKEFGIPSPTYSGGRRDEGSTVYRLTSLRVGGVGALGEGTYSEEKYVRREPHPPLSKVLGAHIV